jgi:hypothetical protein
VSLPIRRAIYGKMSGDTTLNALLGVPATGYSKSIYYQVAPANAGYPFVVFQKQSGVPIYQFGTQPNTSAKFETDVWLIKAVDRNTSADAAETVQARLNTLLTDGTLSISGGTQMYLRRQSDVEYLEDEDGVRYQHAGSLYRLLHQ